MNNISLDNILAVLSLSFVGIVIFAIVFWLMVKLSPFSVQKEIEVDQNTSLAILFGSVFIALAILISAGIS
jgi:putative membrane protein|tara:strand:- start:394 stop:606 length:213 start_codon:yes stop_codon:yes gene_type:complete